MIQRPEATGVREMMYLPADIPAGETTTGSSRQPSAGDGIARQTAPHSHTMASSCHDQAAGDDLMAGRLGAALAWCERRRRERGLEHLTPHPTASTMISSPLDPPSPRTPKIG